MNRMSSIRRLLTNNVANIIGIIIAIALSVRLIQTVHDNYVLERQIDELRTQIANLSEEKQVLEYNQAYYQTDSFKQKEARAKLGLQQPGENVLILPHPSDVAAQKEAAKPAPKPKSNWGQWVDFLSGKL